MFAARSALIVVTTAFALCVAIGDRLRGEPSRGGEFVAATKAQPPSTTCAKARAVCLRAHAREGQFGSRYVPPGEGAECEAAYQTCVKPDRCTSAERACLRGATHTTSDGVEYVPPEDAAQCHEAYEACVSEDGAPQQKDAQSSPAATDVNISGNWGSNIGVDYRITQTGQSFRWVVVRGIPGETAEGSINGNKVSARWSGPNSRGSASGVVAGGRRPTRIEWSNGVVFLRR